MKICFLTAGDIAWASSRMRAYWPSQYLDAVARPLATIDQNVRRHGRAAIPAADAYIFQKLYSGRVRDLLPPSALVVWDVCDPLWWFDPQGCKDVLAAVDGVTACTQFLANDLRNWDGWNNDKPIFQVHDCIDLEHFPVKAAHSDHEPIRLIWYGIATNRVSLYGAQPFLERLTAEGYRIALTIMDDRPDITNVFPTPVNFPISFIRWSLGMENEVIAAHDIALLPPYPGEWGRLKSDNKQWTAAACGVPATSGAEYDQLRQLVKSAGTRRRYAERGAKTAALFTPQFVAQDWWKALDDLSRHQQQRAVFAEDTAVFAAA